MSAMLEKFKKDFGVAKRAGLSTQICIYLYYETRDTLTQDRYFPVMTKKHARISFAVYISLHGQMPYLPCIKVRNVYYVFPFNTLAVQMAIKAFYDSASPEHDIEFHDTRLSFIRDRTLDQTGSPCLFFFPRWIDRVRNNIGIVDPSSMIPVDFSKRLDVIHSGDVSPILLENVQDVHFKVNAYIEHEKNKRMDYVLPANSNKKKSEFHLSLLATLYQNIVIQEIRQEEEKKKQDKKQIAKRLVKCFNI